MDMSLRDTVWTGHGQGCTTLRVAHALPTA